MEHAPDFPAHQRLPAPHASAAFLRDTLPAQGFGVGSYLLDGCRVWLKKAPRRNPRWRYSLMNAGASLLRLGSLRPVVNPGGEAALETEVQRIAALASLGLRVPVVLAQQRQALLLLDVGGWPDNAASRTLGEEMQRLLAIDPPQALALWRQGLDSIALVHGRGAYLSQAFARNLICCADGGVGYVDFEDDPRLTLGAAQCQARDWICYLLSTALMLHGNFDMEALRRHWRDVVCSSASAEVRQELRHASRRAAWLRRLPAGRRWGLDTQRLRAAAFLLTEFSGVATAPQERP